MALKLLFLLAICAILTEAFLQNEAVKKKIFDDLSWSTRVLLYKDFFNSTSQRRSAKQAMIVKGVPIRRVGFAALQDGRRQEDPAMGQEKDKEFADDKTMKIKLFRLMYETVQDTELKAKRAELIREHYNNNIPFDVGFLMGDITDKFSVMSDIGSTLARMYAEWAPLEHVNAYEQIANQAIEINHLVDLVKSMERRDPTLKPQYRSRI